MRRWVKVLRLTAFLAVVFGGLAFYGLRRARADATRVLMGIGAQMMRYANTVTQDDPRALVLNGQPLSFTSGTTHDSVSALLDEYGRRCAQRGVLGERGTLRQGDGVRGFVACFDAGHEVGPEEALERVRAFLTHKDLSEVGRFRYVYAERGIELTRFITFFADGPVMLDRLLPPEGDAPGRDVSGLERPPGTRRLLSAFEVGQPYGLVIYGGGSDGVDKVVAWYRERLPKAGWTILSETAAGEGHGFDLRGKGTRLSLVVFEGGASILWEGQVP